MRARFIGLLLAFAALGPVGCSVGLAQDRRPRLSYGKHVENQPLEDQEFTDEQTTRDQAERKKLIEALRGAQAFAI